MGDCGVKNLLLALLFAPVMANASHCSDIAMMAGAMLESRKSGVNYKYAMSYFNSVKVPSKAARNESLAILNWVYEVPKDTATYEFMNDVIESCEEFYSEN